ncbi:hypothetical protein HUG10_19730 (plasmid) [Halorarum halophilum]|uniref:Halobacterial output domain-containing protein n=1 Tax=Halorarum halophilum TaxID=2743090 RepID=A0A7D5L326_9EURY|nr:HalOD1 output domain-containing protein [Halobaculum halophilum]QLG29843.1 hypothetical protein HUG10_19730 [Halobaculum halophilum]
MREEDASSAKVAVPPVSERVLEAVAEEEGEQLVESDERLNDVVDPDALNKLLTDARADLTVEFSFLDYQILARGDGDVIVSA